MTKVQIHGYVSGHGLIYGSIHESGQIMDLGMVRHGLCHGPNNGLRNGSGHEAKMSNHGSGDDRSGHGSVHTSGHESINGLGHGSIRGSGHK